MSTKLFPQTYVHGSKLLRKVEGDESLRGAVEAYMAWKASSLEIHDREPRDIRALTELLNDYKNAVEPIFDDRPNSAQEVLQPSIIEEFFEYLFCRLPDHLGKNLLRRPASSYIDLIFNPKELETLISAPEFTVRRKDHDFVIGATVTITVSAEDSDIDVQEALVIPAIAIECKRYLERNMLDECSGTAEKLKRATPYCLYYVVAEYLKMDDASPELSSIDEIYILRKQRNSERLDPDFVPNPIDSDLVQDLYQQCFNHLQKVWWDPEAALKSGKVFNIPR